VDDIVELVAPQRIASPCVNVCRIDPATRQCRGCARTIDEVARWTSMTEAERNAVMMALPARKKS
jgi:predicted Fe-S protein YdhL (DUF1289 family)